MSARPLLKYRSRAAAKRQPCRALCRFDGATIMNALYQSLQSLRTSLFALAMLVIAMFSSSVRADGFIVIHNPPPQPVTPGHFTFAPLEVTYHRVNVEVNDSVATTTVD